MREENVAWRNELLALCDSDDSVRRAVFERCFDGGGRGLLFWIDAFVWQVNPREGDKLHGPFICRGYQREIFRQVHDFIESGQSHAIEKSRYMGGSWMILIVFLWFWLFRENGRFLVSSESEEKVDGPDEDALLPKIDYMIERLPKWMVPPGYFDKSGDGGKCRVFKSIKNPVTKSTIRGSATKEDLARGGRRRALLLDEHASMKKAREIQTSVASVTDCFISVSTPKGLGTFQSELVHSGAIPVLRMHWTDCDEFTVDRYECVAGCRVHPNGGKPHSPWYDKECAKLNFNRQMIAQELDLDYATAGGAFFNMEMVEKAVKTLRELDIKLDHYDFEWEKDTDKTTVPVMDRTTYHKSLKKRGVVAHKVEHSPCSVWMPPIVGHTYTIGADVSKGLPEGDFHAAYVLDATDGVIVAEWHGKCDPDDFAEKLAQLARWYETVSGKRPYCAVEWNDQGTYVNQIMDRIGCWLHVSRSDDAKQRSSNKIGLVVPTQRKAKMLSENLSPVISRADDDGMPELVCPFIGFWLECTTFVAVPVKSGELTPEKAKVGGQGKKCDDRVMAMNHTLFAANFCHGKWKGVKKRTVQKPDSRKRVSEKRTLFP